MSDIRKYMKQRDSKLSKDNEEDELEKKLKSHRRGKVSKVIILILIIAVKPSLISSPDKFCSLSFKNFFSLA